MTQTTSHHPFVALQQYSRMGDALIEQAKLTREDVERILAHQQENSLLFGEAAKQLGLVTDDDLKRVLSDQYEYAYVDTDSSQFDASLIAAYSPFSLEAEQIRSLRSQLMMKWLGQGNKTIALCAPNPEDDSHVVAANLAIVLSQLNKRTLLIDANLRRGRLHRLFSIDTKVGLANILANRLGQYHITRLQSLPNLSVLTAGTEVPNPQELLAKTAFAELVASLEQAYDYIIVDTAPLSFGTDLLSVVSVTRGVVLVSKKDVTQTADLMALANVVRMTEATLLGSVFQEI